MLTKLGVATHEMGDDDNAERLLTEAVRRAAAVGSGDALVEAHIGAGSTARRRGDLGMARDHLHEALALSEGHAVLDCARVHVELVHTAASAADLDVATVHARDALALARQVGDARTLVRLAEGLAGAIAVSDSPGDAVPLLASATAVRNATSITPSPSEQQDVDRLTNRLRSRVDSDTFAQIWAAAQTRAADHPLPALERLVEVQTSGLRD